MKKKTEDLVTELRAWGTNGYMMQAADEIERLRKERDELQKQVDELLDEKHAPRGAWGDFCNE